MRYQSLRSERDHPTGLQGVSVTEHGSGEFYSHFMQQVFRSGLIGGVTRRAAGAALLVWGKNPPGARGGGKFFFFFPKGAPPPSPRRGSAFNASTTGQII